MARAQGWSDDQIRREIRSRFLVLARNAVAGGTHPDYGQQPNAVDRNIDAIRNLPGNLRNRAINGVQDAVGGVAESVIDGMKRRIREEVSDILNPYRLR
jgi:hypothetical protein